MNCSRSSMNRRSIFNVLLSDDYTQLVDTVFTSLVTTDNSDTADHTTDTVAVVSELSDPLLCLPYILLHNHRGGDGTLEKKNNNGDNINNDDKMDTSQEEDRERVEQQEDTLIIIEEYMFLYKDIVSPYILQSISSIQSYIQLDTSSFQYFIQEEFLIRKKLGHLDKKTTFIDVTENLKDAFENGDHIMRMKLVLSDLIGLLYYTEGQKEILEIKSQQQQQQQQLTELDQLYHQTKYEGKVLDTQVYLHELSFIIPSILVKFNNYFDLNNIIISILFLNQAPLLLKIIVFNNPVEFKDIIELVIGSVELIGQDQLKRIVMELCKLSRYSATLIRQRLLEKQMSPDLVLTITSHFIHDEIDFMSNIIVNRNEYIWMRDYLTLKDIPLPFTEIREKLLSMLEKSSSQTEKDTDNQFIIMKSIVRLYCGMGGLLNIKLTSAEVAMCLSLIERNTTKSFSKIYLCFLLVCEGLLKMVQNKKIIDSINSLIKIGYCEDLLLLISIYFHTRQLQNIVYVIKNTLGFRPTIHTESLNQIGELMTKELFPEASVALKASQLPIVEGLSASMIDQPQNNSNISIISIYQLLNERIFEKYETDMGQWIWNQTLKSSTPIHYLLPSCLDKLIKNIIEPTITTNIPLFYMKRIPESTINSVFSQKYNIAVQVLVVYFVLRYNDSVVKYKLDQSIKGKSITMIIETTQLREYSIQFLSKLPIERCLTTIQANPNDYFNIIPPFMYLVSSQLPQLFNSQLLLSEEERLTNKISNYIFNPEYFDLLFEGRGDGSQELIQLIERDLKSNPMSLQLLLKQFSQRRLSTDNSSRYIKILIERLLPTLIQEKSRCVQVESLIGPFTDLWFQQFPNDQLEMALATINVFTTTETIQSNQTNDDGSIDSMYSLKQPIIGQYSHSDVVNDPLLIFRSHPNVFTNPAFMRILIQILYFYMTSSKKSLLSQIQVANVQTKQEDIRTLIYTLESSIIQILLELCVIDKMVGRDILSNDNNNINQYQFNNNNSNQNGPDQANSKLQQLNQLNNNNNSESIYQKYGNCDYDIGDIEEIRCIICNFIHQLFIEKPILIKLIHFQGYFPQLLPITVTHIPSMHICFDFIPELLNQPQVEKQIFSIQLLAFLVEKYPLPKSLKICKLAISKISSYLSNNMNNSSSNSSGNTSNSSTPVIIDRDSYLSQILPSITRICKAFPILSDECVTMLMDLLPDHTQTGNNEDNEELESLALFTPNHNHHGNNIYSTSTDESNSIYDNNQRQTIKDIQSSVQIILKNLSLK